jgi:hypothetical protein
LFPPENVIATITFSILPKVFGIDQFGYEYSKNSYQQQEQPYDNNRYGYDGGNDYGKGGDGIILLIMAMGQYI